MSLKLLECQYEYFVITTLNGRPRSPERSRQNPVERDVSSAREHVKERDEVHMLTPVAPQQAQVMLVRF